MMACRRLLLMIRNRLGLSSRHKSERIHLIPRVLAAEGSTSTRAAGKCSQPVAMKTNPPNVRSSYVKECWQPNISCKAFLLWVNQESDGPEQTELQIARRL